MKYIFFIALFSCSFLLHAQKFTFKKLGMEQGLSNNNVVGITQDREGFLWFATESGLNRFDGNKFKVYKKNDSDANSISSNELNKVLADRNDDIIWIATQRDGLNELDTKTDKFTCYLHDPNDSNSIVTNDITNVTQSRDGNLWISTYYGGVDYFNKKTKKFTHYNQSTIPGFVSNHVWCVAEDDQGLLYIGHVFNGLTVLSPKTHKVENYTYQPGNTNSLPGTEVICIYIDSRKNIWLGTNNGLALYNRDKDNFTVFRNIPGNSFSLADNRVLSIREINGDKLWVGTNTGGVNILDLRQSFSNPAKVVFQHIEAKDNDNGISNQTVHDIFQDSYKNIWIGTSGGGVDVVSSKPQFFHNLSYSPYRDAENTLSSKLAFSICQDNEGNLWIGMDGSGIDVFRRGIKIAHYSKENGKIPDDFITTSLNDNNGNIWFGTGAGELFVYNAKSKKFKRISVVKNLANIRCLYEDNDNNIWIGTYYGLYKYQSETGQLKGYFMDNSDLPDNSVISLSQDVKGNLWVGTLGQGLAVFTPQFKLVRELNKNEGFCSNAIQYILRDSKNRMWIGTRNGLVLFNNCNDKKYRVYSVKDGMADSYVCAISEGRSDNIWFSTYSGISHLNVNNNKIDNYNYLDGITWGNFMPGSAYKSHRGIIYFGSQNGICYFNSNRHPQELKPANATITDFLYFDKKIAQPENAVNLPVNKKITLKYFQNTFRVSFNVLDFGLRNQAEYAYMLEGFEDSWKNAGNEKQVTFQNIPYGNYVFEVKTRLRNQPWSDEISSLRIIVTPPIWLTWWAKTIYFFIVVFIVFYVLRFYKRKLELENSLYLEQKNHQQEQELNDERLRFYTNIAHELRTPLTLIIGPLVDLMKDKTLNQKHVKTVSLIHRSATRLLNLINQIMEFRKTETHNRNLCVVKSDLSVLVSEISLKYKELNQNKKIDLKVDIESKENQLYYDPEVITIILDNLVSNALKYTIKGEVNVVLRKIEVNGVPYSEIEVRDTGLGISPENIDRIFDRYYQVKDKQHISGSGIGLSLVKNLVTIHQGTISVESQLGKGSSFKLRIQTNNKYPEAMHNEVVEKDITEIESANDSKGLMLVVEDNADILEYIADSFADHFEVVEAENGKIGVDMAFEHTPDIIISDIMMPVMDGIELCKIMKDDIRTSHIPVILLTAKDTLQDKTEGYNIGADSYITKPFSAELLQSRVNNLLEARKKMAEQFSVVPPQKQTIITESLNKLDKEFLDKVTSIVEENLDMEQINVAFIADKMNMSHSTLYRKIKALTDLTANEIIRKIKIQNAEKLLLTGKYTVSEISYHVGINSYSYFRQCFKDEYGMSPTEYLKKIKGGEETADS